ncbi:MAG TPA: GNAT family N-acetyltransferase [Dehalococcoidia bacterium]|nr:GNAT family N-acetyltransferase [Dehalococcoidia bacterium]
MRGARGKDLAAIDALIVAEHLPAFRTAEFLDTFWVLESQGRLLGCVGLEVFGEAALLRSVITSSELRGQGYGDVLVKKAFDEAESRGVKRLYLFTLDKALFFARFGFERCTMEDFEPAARQCSQYEILKDHREVAAVLTAMRREI